MAHAERLSGRLVGDGPDARLIGDQLKRGMQRVNGSGSVEGRIDPGVSRPPDAIDQTFAVADGRGSQRAQVLVVAHACGSDDVRAASDRDVNGEAADTSSGRVDQHRVAGAYRE